MERSQRISRWLKALAERQLADLEEKRREIEQMMEGLSVLVQACHGDDQPHCAILDKLSLHSPAQHQPDHKPQLRKGGTPGGETPGGGSSHIDLMASTPINVLPQLQNRTVRPLAITSRKRMGGNLAGVPTFSELGAETEFGNWRGLVGPRGMRPEQLAYWQQVFTKLVATPEWQAELASQLSDDQFMGPADSAKFLNDEHQRLGRILRDLGLAK